VLEVSNLEVVYHSVALVLRGVSLRVPEGTVVALLGPNGAGKTTALRAVSGLADLHDARATKGTVTFGGRDALRLRPDQLVRLGLVQVLEGRRVFIDLTVEENLLAGAYTRRDGDVGRDLDGLYRRFPVLGERRRQPAGLLSGGEQQILAIARALLTRPKLLLLDEPSLGLAPRLVEEVARLIREIHATGVAVLLVEQNARAALDLAGYGYILEHGRIVADGPSDVLRRDRDIQEFYLGLGDAGRRSFRDVRLYRRRKRWLS
jgi:branched-chain amino acid transport system ATP-binding protein